MPETSHPPPAEKGKICQGLLSSRSSKSTTDLHVSASASLRQTIAASISSHQVINLLFEVVFEQNLAIATMEDITTSFKLFSFQEQAVFQ